MKIGQIIKERYEIIEILGEGGMAFVYKAKDKQLQRNVAIKTLKPNYVNQEKFVDRFRREAQTAANLNHPNIVSPVNLYMFLLLFVDLFVFTNSIVLLY